MRKGLNQGSEKLNKIAGSLWCLSEVGRIVEAGLRGVASGVALWRLPGSIPWSPPNVLLFPGGALCPLVGSLASGWDPWAPMGSSPCLCVLWTLGGSAPRQSPEPGTAFRPWTIIFLVRILLVGLWIFPYCLNFCFLRRFTYKKYHANSFNGTSTLVSSRTRTILQ